MKCKWQTALCALALLISLLPAAHAEAVNGDDALVLVGLAYASTALDGANLANDVGNGYRFGYLDEESNFWQIGYTNESAISVVKTQNVWYGLDSSYSSTLKSYSDQITSNIAVGCWHVQVPMESAPATFEEALVQAQSVGGFPAWINNTWQVRLGAYITQAEAQSAAELAGGTVVGTSSYGVSVIKTGTSTVLFQFDGGSALSLTVKPGMDESVKTVTYFKGNRYYGAFQFCRVNGGDMVVSNLLPLGDYINCVISREMSSSWPVEALKAQAVCARNYYENNLGKHKSYGIDICSTTDCQAYYGMASTNERTAQAVAETAGLRAWYEGKTVQTFYFSSSGGGTEDVRNVWSSTASYPYLCGVIDPYEATVSDKIAYWDYTQTFTASQITSILQSKGYGNAAILDFQITALTPTGNVKSIAFVDENGKSWPFTKESGVRNLLGLKSMRYTVVKSGGTSGGTYYIQGGGTLDTMNGAYAIAGNGSVGMVPGSPYVITGSSVQSLQMPSNGASEGELTFTVHSSGWGHSVGMSQWGAYAMARQGKTFDEILKFYYPGVEIK